MELGGVLESKSRGILKGSNHTAVKAPVHELSWSAGFIDGSCG